MEEALTQIMGSLGSEKCDSLLPSSLKIIKILCSSSNKDTRLQGYTGYSKFLEQYKTEELKKTKCCYSIVKPLQTTRHSPFYKDKDCSLKKLEILWSLLLKVQNIMQLEGPQSILEVLIQSCVLWCEVDPYEKVDSELETTSLKLINDILSKGENSNIISKDNFYEKYPPLSSPVFISSKFFSRFAASFTKIFHDQKFHKNGVIYFKIWHKLLNYLEQSWKVVDIKVWHELFTILNQVSNNNLITSHYRLEFLYLAATTLKSVLHQSKYIDTNNVMMTPAIFMLKTSCNISRTAPCLELSQETSFNLFDYCKNITYTLSKSLYKTFEFLDILMSFCTKLDSVLYPTYLWGLWTGCSISFCELKALSPLDKDDILLYRKLRSISANFDLDEHMLEKRCRVAVRETIERVNQISWKHLRTESQPNSSQLPSSTENVVRTKELEGEEVGGKVSEVFESVVEEEVVETTGPVYPTEQIQEESEPRVEVGRRESEIESRIVPKTKISHESELIVDVVPEAVEIQTEIFEAIEPILEVVSVVPEGFEPMKEVGSRVQEESEPMKEVGSGVPEESEPMKEVGSGVQEESEPMKEVGSGVPEESEPMKEVGSRVQEESEPMKEVGSGVPEESEPMKEVGSGVPEESEPMKEVGSGVQEELERMKEVGSRVQEESEPMKEVGSRVVEELEPIMEIGGRVPDVSKEIEPIMKVAVSNEIEPIMKVEVSKEIEPIMKVAVSKEIEPIMKVAVSNEIEPIMKVGVSKEIEPIMKVEVSKEIEPIMKVAVSKEIEPIMKVAVSNEIEPIMKVGVSKEIEPIMKVAVSNEIEPIMKVAISNEIEPIMKVELSKEIEPITKVAVSKEIEPIIKVENELSEPIEARDSVENQFGIAELKTLVHETVHANRVDIEADLFEDFEINEVNLNTDMYEGVKCHEIESKCEGLNVVKVFELESGEREVNETEHETVVYEMDKESRFELDIDKSGQECGVMRTPTKLTEPPLQNVTPVSSRQIISLENSTPNKSDTDSDVFEQCVSDSPSSEYVTCSSASPKTPRRRRKGPDLTVDMKNMLPTDNRRKIKRSSSFSQDFILLPLTRSSPSNKRSAEVSDGEESKVVCSQNKENEVLSDKKPKYLLKKDSASSLESEEFQLNKNLVFKTDLSWKSSLEKVKNCSVAKRLKKIKKKVLKKNTEKEVLDEDQCFSSVDLNIDRPTSGEVKENHCLSSVDLNIDRPTSVEVSENQCLSSVDLNIEGPPSTHVKEELDDNCSSETNSMNYNQHLVKVEHYLQGEITSEDDSNSSKSESIIPLDILNSECVFQSIKQQIALRDLFLKPTKCSNDLLDRSPKKPVEDLVDEFFDDSCDDLRPRKRKKISILDGMKSKKMKLCAEDVTTSDIKETEIDTCNSQVDLFSTPDFSTIQLTPVKNLDPQRSPNKSKFSPSTLYSPSIDKSSRASKMLALVPDSQFTLVENNSIKNKSKSSSNSVQFSKYSRASKMLALVDSKNDSDDCNVCVVPSLSDLSQELTDCSGSSSSSEWKRYEPTNKDPGPSALKSNNMLTPPRRKSIRFDDDRNETVVYPIESPPIQSVQDYYRRLRSKKMNRLNRKKSKD